MDRARYAVAVQACVVEDIGSRLALKRSTFLTAGDRGRVIIVHFAFLILVLASDFIFGAPTLLLPSSGVAFRISFAGLPRSLRSAAFRIQCSHTYPDAGVYPKVLEVLAAEVRSAQKHTIEKEAARRRSVQSALPKPTARELTPSDALIPSK